jgi:crotonobetainyl-CoA:carnitine CoA-transferase CaiB-like acyl-CoA transferase
MAQISGSSERHIVDLKRGDYEELDQLAVAEPFAKAAYRVGNRSRGHVQGVYPTAADDAWVALFVCDDADWADIVEAMGRPDLLRDSGFASAEQWRLAHDEFDTVVADWTLTQTAVDIVNALGAQHVPAEQVLTPDRMYDIPHSTRVNTTKRSSTRLPGHTATRVGRSG